MKNTAVLFIIVSGVFLGTIETAGQDVNLRKKEYASGSKEDALKWQIELRGQFFNLLKMDDLIADQEKPDVSSSVPITEDRSNYIIKELEIN